MNKKFLQITRYIILVFMLLQYGCGHKNPILEELEKINQISEFYPDSAFNLLGKINRNNFSIDLENRYKLLNIKINARNDMDIKSDTIEMEKIKEYFLKGKSDSLIVVSYYYSSVIYIESNNKEKALQELLNAEKYSASVFSLKPKIQFSIANINYYSSLFIDAKSWYREAYNAYFSIDKKWAANCLSGLGNCFQMIENYDSALYYYQQSISLLESINETAGINLIQNMAYAYCRLGKYETVKKISLPLLNDTLNINTDKRKHYLYMNLADAYFYTDNIDSASYFINKTKDLELNDNAKLMSMYYLWYLIEKEKNNYELALQLHETYMFYDNEVMKVKNSNEITEIQGKFKNEELINENNQLTIKKQRILIFSVLVFFILLIIIALIYYNWKKTKEHNKQIENDLDILDTYNKQIENDLDTLNTYNKQIENDLNIINQRNEQVENDLLLIKKLHNELGKSVHDLLLIPVNIAKRAIRLKKIEDKTYKHTKITNLFEELASPEFIISIIDSIDNEYHRKFKNKYPDMNDSEVVICYMILFGFEKKEIGNLLEYSEFTIQQKITNIRKKLQIKERGDIKNFIETNFQRLSIEK